MANLSIIDKLKRSKILDLLQEGKRIDDRALDEPRPLVIDIGVIPHANGSARVRLGDTEIVSGIKVQPDRPFPDMGDKGIFMCTAEILPLAHPSAETGPPQPDVIELARVVDRGIRESGMIDLSQFVLEKDKSVIGLFADSVVTDHDGNLFDACSYASVAAIITSKIPKWEMKDDIPVLIENQESDAPITTIPISVTMGRIGEFIIVDPNIDEWGCLDARITITTNSDGNIVALQKGGSDGFTFEQLVKCSELSIAVGKKIRETVKQATEGGQ
ncbi:MAG: Exosome complex component Rrp42 [Thaumarchaeota archaeon]|jgi:exosome complex component RRP42|nr:Exosome complex component Rrp42 [Nitrososphaerota archaeon]